MMNDQQMANKQVNLPKVPFVLFACVFFLFLSLFLFFPSVFKRQVSWIRRTRDYHLLTVGLTTYSGDERYSVSHAKHSEVSKNVANLIDGIFITTVVYLKK